MSHLASLALPVPGARVVAVHPVLCGALPVVLEHEGVRFQVDVFRREGAATPGLVETQRLSLFLRNGGDGGRESGRTRELAARGLGVALEASGSSATLASRLLTFDERTSRHPGAVYDVDYGPAARIA